MIQKTGSRKLEEQLYKVGDYYPFGLTMAGISPRAIGKLENRRGYNGNELQFKEFINGSGLETYDFNARTYDQQLGRYLQIDPESEEEHEGFSPYHFATNNPVLLSDPVGKNPFPKLLSAAVDFTKGHLQGAASIVTGD